jgi:hypothetical protein
MTSHLDRKNRGVFVRDGEKGGQSLDFLDEALQSESEQMEYGE